MLTAKLVRLDTAWSTTPQPRRMTALPFSRRKIAAGDFGAPGRAGPAWESTSAAMHAAPADDGHARHMRPDVTTIVSEQDPHPSVPQTSETGLIRSSQTTLLPRGSMTTSL